VAFSRQRRSVKLIVALSSVVFFWSAAQVHAAGVKEDYELQERCGQRAEQVFKDTGVSGITNTPEGQDVAGFENHYNKILNKCFMLRTITSLSYKDKKKKKSSSKLVTLFDVNENKAYGAFFKQEENTAPFLCRVKDSVCASEAAWDALIRPYMEE